MTPSLSEPVTSAAPGEISPSGYWNLANRKLIAHLFVAVAMAGLISAVTYLVGRLGVKRDPVAAPAALSQPRPASLPSKPVATPAPPPVVSAPEKPPLAPEPVVPAPGQSFLQVTATDKAMAAKVAGSLIAQNLPTRIVEGPSPDIVRVIVGPIGTVEQADSWKKAIEKNGFKPFPRKY